MGHGCIFRILCCKRCLSKFRTSNCQQSGTRHVPSCLTTSTLINLISGPELINTQGMGLGTGEKLYLHERLGDKRLNKGSVRLLRSLGRSRAEG